MSFRFYDEAVYRKIQEWIVDPNMRILKPEETQRLFQVQADLNNDKPIKLPLIAISRDRTIDFNINTKRNLSYDGLKLISKEGKTAQLNAIPFTTNYQLDIYTSKIEDGEEYLREFVINFVNNPSLEVEIPYNGIKIKHKANLKFLGTAEDNSDIPERLYIGQFTRWTINLELQDAYIFDTSIKKNYKIIDNVEDYVEMEEKINPDVEGTSGHNGFTHIIEEEVD